MADKKDLRGCMEKMREVALFLNEWADDMEAALAKKKGGNTAAEDVSGEERTCLVQVPGPAASVPMAQDSAPAVPASDPAAPAPDSSASAPDQPLTAQKVHDFLRDKCAAGFRTQVEALINSFGAEKFSGVAPVHYPELMKAAAALGAGDENAG